MGGRSGPGNCSGLSRRCPPPCRGIGARAEPSSRLRATACQPWMRARKRRSALGGDGQLRFRRRCRSQRTWNPPWSSVPRYPGIRRDIPRSLPRSGDTPQDLEISRRISKSWQRAGRSWQIAEDNRWRSGDIGPYPEISAHSPESCGVSAHPGPRWGDRGGISGDIGPYPGIFWRICSFWPRMGRYGATSGDIAGDLQILADSGQILADSGGSCAVSRDLAPYPGMLGADLRTLADRGRYREISRDVAAYLLLSF